MFSSFTVFMEIIPAAIAGTCFVLLFLYFHFARESSQKSYRLFSSFLLALCLFTLLKPLQLLAGESLWALIICNVRYLILFCLAGPMFVLANETLRGASGFSPSRRPFYTGLLFSLVYLTFNSLGGDYKRISLTSAALYGLLFFSGCGIRSFKASASPSSPREKALRCFAVGGIVFGLALAVSSILNTFWMLYFLALPSALFCAYGVYLEMKNFYRQHEKMVPLIRENILQDISFLGRKEKEMSETLSLAGLKVHPDTVLQIKAEAVDGIGPEEVLKKAEALYRYLCRRLSSQLGKENYLLINNGSLCCVLCLSSSHLGSGDSDFYNYGEALLEDLLKKGFQDVSIGIGDTHGELEKLEHSYRQARRAQNYARRAGACMIAFEDDIAQTERQKRYPEMEKSELLQSLSEGREESLAQLIPA
jgi:hypothetical protein